MMERSQMVKLNRRRAGSGDECSNQTAMPHGSSRNGLDCRNRAIKAQGFCASNVWPPLLLNEGAQAQVVGWSDPRVLAKIFRYQIPF
jgi:hypothetical protein